MNNNDRIKVKQINDHIYLMDDNREATGYIVIGDKKYMEDYTDERHIT